MTRVAKLTTASAAVLILAACASTRFTSTWKNPGASTLGNMQGKTIVACVAVEDEYLRRGVEDALASEVTKRGANGVTSYSVLLPGIKDEALAKAAFEKIGASAAVVMRPVAGGRDVVSTTAVYGNPYYGGFWGGYWGYGWGTPYRTVTVQTDTIVHVETLFYSLEQNKLVWAGQSKTTNPKGVASFVRELVTSVVWEMNKAKVF